MSFLHLLWIVPLAAGCGFFTAAVLSHGGDSDE